MSWTGCMTNAGIALEAQCLEGHTLAISDTAVAGTTTSATPKALTSITGTNVAIVSSESVTGGVRLGVRVTSVDVTTSYTCKIIGIYGALDGGAQTLLAVGQDGDDTGFVVPTFADTPDYSYTVYLFLAYSNEGSLTVNISTSALATVGDLNAHIANTNAHNIGSAGHLPFQVVVTNTNNEVPTGHAVISYVDSYKPYHVGGTPPANTNRMWIDTADVSGGLKYYDEGESAWVHVPVAYTA